MDATEANQQLASKNNLKQSSDMTSSASSYNSANTSQYTLADVPRLAEYSASMYASTTAEHEHYVKYYTQYYISEITSGQYANLPTISQLGESANSGAAVAMSAIQREQNNNMGVEVVAAAAPAAVVTAALLNVPKGNDGKKYR